MGDHPPPARDPNTNADGTPVAIGVAPERAVTRPEGRRTAAYVIGGLLLASVGVAAIAYIQFSRSEEMILADLAAIREKGATIGVEGCVDEVLDWHGHRCTAMLALCDRSVGRLMEQCLDGRDRTDYCGRVDLSDAATTRFGHADCEERGKAVPDKKKGKDLKKQCGTAYRAIAFFCSEVRKMTPATVSAVVTSAVVTSPVVSP